MLSLRRGRLSEKKKNQNQNKSRDYLMVELRYCLNIVTRQIARIVYFNERFSFYWFTYFFSFSHVFTVAELPHLINVLNQQRASTQNARQLFDPRPFNGGKMSYSNQPITPEFCFLPSDRRSFFLKNPSKYFGGDNDCPSRKPCTRYDVASDIRSNQISRSTARCVFGTVYLKMS